MQVLASTAGGRCRADASIPELTMIVCQCNILSKGEIEAAVERLLKDDPWRLIVPSTVYHAMGQRGRCCGCFPDVVEIIAEVTARRRSVEDKQTAAAARRM